MRATRQRAAKPPELIDAVPTESPEGESPLVVAVRAELEAADRLGCALGQQALALAQRIGNPFDTGSAVASLSKELRAVMDAALADAPKAADALDELAGRRQQKASSA